MSYSNKVKNYSGDTAGDWSEFNFLGTEKGDVWFLEGIKYFINRVKTTSPDNLYKFTYDRVDGDSGTAFEGTQQGQIKYINPFDDAKWWDIYSVYILDTYDYNKKFIATQVDESIAPYLLDVNSMYYVTKKNPVYYKNLGQLYIAPGNSGTPGFNQIYYDTAFTFGEGSTESTRIMYFPSEYEIFPILYTAKQILKFKLTVMRNRLPDVPDYDGYAGGDTSDTLSTAYGEGWNAVRFYIESEEDAELANLKMNELTQEQQTFLTDYQWLQGQLQEVKEEYEQQFVAAFGVVGG